MALSSLDPRVIGRLLEPAGVATVHDEGTGLTEAGNLTITEARDLLDWLEAHGIRASEVSADPAGKMIVRWAA
jgi:hypothetical protein